MKDFMRWLFWAGLPLWIMFLGGTMLLIGGVNNCMGCSSIFEAIRVTNNFWVKAGALVSGIGLGMGIVMTVRAFLKK